MGQVNIANTEALMVSDKEHERIITLKHLSKTRNSEAS